MFDKILIANRGEIACRVARTCRRLGIRTVAVYSEADARARHVALCDEAYLLGPAAARESYLCVDKILAAAQASGAQAIHPGYGFLSENAEFAAACAQAGIVFIGPPAAAIRAMGSKSAAKRIMENAAVPLVPGYHGEDQNPELLRAAAARIGYPVLIKAVSGGGGKGMRVVMTPGEFDAALASARREAASSFADERVLVEKYLLQPRHIEVQVFADTCGNVLHLFERDCSIQRRHQKVLEEAPAPGMSAERRAAMGAAAVAAAQAIGYVGAGTVEFIAEPSGAFYFMEMNTRLQVEHPVTEMITGQDLVEWQLRVAAGEALPCRQEELTLRGHAFEARIYAEDPERDFLPATGTLAYLHTPAESAHVRIDTGVMQGDEVSVFYDPMIAKLIVWDQDRKSALRRLRQALADYRIVGLTTNLRFLAALAAQPALADGAVHTGFIAEHQQELFAAVAPADDRLLALAALGELLRIAQAAADNARRSLDPWSPWHAVSGWRLNDDNQQDLHFHDAEQEFIVIAHYRADHYRLELPSGVMNVRGELDADGELAADLDGLRLTATLVRSGATLTVLAQGRMHSFTVHDPRMQGLDDEADSGSLNAPMPGTVIQVLVTVGQAVDKGTPLLILEAMKMEHTLTAPRAGVVAEVRYRVGEQVREGEALLVLGDTLIQEK